MLQLLRTVAIIFVVVVLVLTDNKSSVVKSEPLPFCGYHSSNKTSTCPGDSKVEILPPFWIENSMVYDETRSGECMGYPGFQIKCAAANGRPVINISSNLYYVLGIDRVPDSYSGGRLSVVDVVIDAQECPQPRRSFSISSQRFLMNDYYYNGIDMIVFYNCSRYPQDVVQNIPCLNVGNNSGRSFAFLKGEIPSDQFDWYRNCEEAVVVPVRYGESTDQRITNYTDSLKAGFDLLYKYPVNCRNCKLSGGKCSANETNLPITTSFYCNCTDCSFLRDDICQGNRYYSLYHYGYSEGSNNALFILISVLMYVAIGLGGVLLIVFGVYIRKCCTPCNSTGSICRRIVKGHTNVDVFFEENYGDLSLNNFKYSDIKKMTNSFKDTLGQGEFASVFKGKLPNGQLVAVKVLNESKGKGEDFINEVASIGRTNHVNVVSLLGFCAKGTKRALVYEFMPNGSLEKFVHNAKDDSSTTSSFLGWEKLYQVALGIARGLEYLHRGCNTRILHLDIKPHNILLDQDFCPKISDFGLAKLCPTKESIVSMVGPRGTPGYIAPEVCCANFGGVSHKSDVYSYGMMLLEMIGGRKNIDLTVDKTSEIFFPQWIYKRLGDFKVQGSEDIEVVAPGEVFEEETTQKMIIVALWCIQAHPGDRPSMTKVVDMLEGNTEDLQFPPNPFPGPSTSLP